MQQSCKMQQPKTPQCCTLCNIDLSHHYARFLPLPHLTVRSRQKSRKSIRGGDTLRFAQCGRHSRRRCLALTFQPLLAAPKALTECCRIQVSNSPPDCLKLLFLGTPCPNRCKIAAEHVAKRDLLPAPKLSNNSSQVRRCSARTSTRHISDTNILCRNVQKV